MIGVGTAPQIFGALGKYLGPVDNAEKFGRNNFGARSQLT